MTACLESARQSKMDPVTPTWKLTVTDRRLMWLQKNIPELWAMGAFKEPSSPATGLGCGMRRDS
jgi:hypothetical protein